MPPHNGRTGRIGETLHHTFVVVKAVLDRPFLTAFDVPANVAATFRIDRSGGLEARHAVSPHRAMLHERLSAEAWPQVKAEFTKALALRS